MSVDDRLMSALARAIAGEVKRASATSTHSAKVVRVDPDGTMWVSIPGGADETPVRTSLVSAEPGDVVSVSIADGRATATGNMTSPAATSKSVSAVDGRVDQVADVADQAIVDAGRAQAAADSAEESAALAQRGAETAWEWADEAHVAADGADRSARTANTAANSALTQLSVVEDVLGTVSWIAEHGTYARTADTSVQEGKVYFERSGSGTEQDPYLYTAVAEPTDDGLAHYYELRVDEALSRFVASHLSLTDAGLWVLKDSSAYRTLMSNTGFSVVAPDGDTVATYGEQTTFASDRPWYVGNQDAFIYYDGDACYKSAEPLCGLAARPRQTSSRASTSPRRRLRRAQTSP